MELEASVVWRFGLPSSGNPRTSPWVYPAPIPLHVGPGGHTCLQPALKRVLSWAGQFTPQTFIPSPLDGRWQLWNCMEYLSFQDLPANLGWKQGKNQRLAKQMEFTSSFKEEAVETNIVRLRRRSTARALQQAGSSQRAKGKLK